MTTLVAVYGTLKMHRGNHHVIELAGGKLKGVGRTKSSHLMVSLGGFPGVILSEEGCPVYVEVYEVEKIGPLDALEGYPHFYDRDPVEVETGEGPVTAWMYHLPKEYKNRPIVEDGEW